MNEELYIEENISRIEMEELTLESSVEKEDTDSNVNTQPYDPEKISINTKPVTMETFLRRYKQESIIMNPDFQRQEVWTPTRKSLLIESLMLKIPIPMFYVSSDEKGIFTVIDGLQRLSAVRDFILGHKDKDGKTKKLRLENLEFWKDYEGKIFDDLPDFLQNRILETEFTFTIVNPGTPEEVKLNIFKRINTGGMPLSSQEIRNALYVGKATRLLHNLSESKEFKTATCHSIVSQRMEDKEIILRYLYFLLFGYEESESKSMDDKLCRTMKEINSKEDSYLESLSESFKVAMTRCYDLFEKHTFRKSYGERRRRPINKCLFEVWGYFMTLMSPSDYQKIKCNKNGFINDYNRELESATFVNSITQGTWSSSSIKDRFKTINELVKKYTYV